ncbi:transcriptional regulator [Priestia aryabhattai]|uniref:transcriptional regulator n=1 Tax=Priestia aryabhattai TaxID=412384 RepID=UPI00203B8E4B|nr:transcriptional regulator [Priestia aryabhattai]MCM3770783.1 transcriptional regulator [Priestia aryabhattai]
MHEKWILVLFISPFLLLQSFLLFINAKKRGAHPWFWGIWGLIQIPMPTLFYCFFIIWLPARRKKGECK